MTQSSLRTVRRAIGAGLIGLSVLALQGCGLSSITSGIGGGILGGSTGSTTPRGVSEEQLLTAAKSDGDVGTDLASTAGGCPPFLIWSREKHLTIYEGDRVGDGLAIVHQGEITRVARECSFEPGRVTVKYGFSGRLLLGPRGQPGVAQLPVQVFVLDPNREKIDQASLSVAVSIKPDTPISYFSTVRTATFPIKEGARPGDYKIYVGFDKPAPAPAPTAQRGARGPRG